MLGEDDPGSLAWTIRATVALSNTVETIAGRDYPCIGGGALEIFAEILKNGRVFGRDGGEVIEGFVHAGGQARGRDVVAQDSLVRDVGEEARLGGELVQHVGDVFLALRRKCFLVAGSAAEGDDNDFPLFASRFAPDERTRAHQRRTEGHACSGAKEIAPAETQAARRLTATERIRRCTPGSKSCAVRRPRHWHQLMGKIDRAPRLAAHD